MVILTTLILQLVCTQFLHAAENKVLPDLTCTVYAPVGQPEPGASATLKFGVRINP